MNIAHGLSLKMESILSNNKRNITKSRFGNLKHFLDININSVGLFLFYCYIASTYLAQDTIFPSSINSLFLYLFLGWGILHFILYRKIKICIISKWQIVFIAICLLTMIYSPTKQVVTGQFYSLLVVFILVLFFAQIEFKKEFIFQIGYVYAISAAFLDVWLLFSGNIHDTTGRLGNELLGNANILASLIMTSSIYITFLLVYGEKVKLKKIFLIFTLLLNYYVMFLSGGRKFIFVPIVSLYVLLLYKTDSIGRRHMMRYSIIIVSAIFAIYMIIMNIPIFYDSIGYRMDGLFNLFSGEGKVDFSSQERADMIDFGLSQWTKSPMWGYGFDSFKNYYGHRTGVFAYSHNNYVELLFDLGIIGFAIYYSFYIYIIKRVLLSKGIISNYARAFSAAVIVSFLIYEFGAVNYSSVASMIMIYLASQAVSCNQKV